MKKVLFVCSGNTCRSPMAEKVFDKIAGERGVDASALSAGLYTDDGLPYAENSVKALKEIGIDLAGASRQITSALLAECDYVFGLTYSISTALVASYPQFSDKIYRFPVEVPDPFGGDLVTYKRALLRITEGVTKVVDALATGKL